MLNLVAEWLGTQSNPQTAMGFDFLAMHQALLQTEGARLGTHSKKEYENKIEELQRELDQLKEKYSKVLLRDFPNAEQIKGHHTNNESSRKDREKTEEEGGAKEQNVNHIKINDNRPVKS